MRVLIVGGQEQHGERLQRIAARAGLELEVERLGAPRGVRLEQPGEAEQEGEPRPLAVVFEALDRADRAVPVAHALKNDGVLTTKSRSKPGVASW